LRATGQWRGFAGIQTTELDSLGRFKASALVLLYRNEDFRLVGDGFDWWN
jgi:hypothetical protein